jgi:O-antigen ligase
LLSGGAGLALLSLVSTSWTVKFSWLAPFIKALPALLLKLPGAVEGFHPNEVAGALLWIIFPALSAVLIGFQYRKIWLVLTGLPTAAVVAFVFLLAQSRGGYIGFTLTLLFLFSLLLPTKARVASWLILIVIAGMIGGSLLNASADTGGITVSDDLNSIEGRIELWSRALYGLGDFPLTGMGMNTFRYLVHALYPLFLTSPDFDLGHAHNEFLQVALDLGLPGLIAFSGLYLCTLWLLRKTWQVCAWRDRVWLLGLLGGLLAHAIFGLTDAIALGAKPGALFWLLLGVIVAIHQQKTAKTQRIRNPRLN